VRFQIHHRTAYHYAGAATESFMEARLRPATTTQQTVVGHRLDITPGCNVHGYTDYFGNHVDTFSIIRRHEALVLDSRSTVDTHPVEPPEFMLEVSVSEARQIYRSESRKLFEYLAPSAAIRFSAEINRKANRFFRAQDELGPSLLALNHWFKEAFRYEPGSTRLDTSVDEVLERRTGVCQDFAQLMIAILRSAELPTRYVVGYIETEAERLRSQRRKAPPKLIGAAESHAWVEVCLPGGFWWPLDPTNDCVAGERHVKVAVGRDYQDSTPTRGAFKGAKTKRLEVAVSMQRAPQPAAVTAG